LPAVVIGATFRNGALSLNTLPTAALVAGAAGACTRGVTIAAGFAVRLACRNTCAAIAKLTNAAVHVRCALRRWWSVANASDAVVGTAVAVAFATNPGEPTVIA